jgi:hypothetical protein
MAIHFTGPTPHEERGYTPQVFGNRQDPKPCKVWIKTPTEKDKREVEGDGSVINFAVDSDGMPLRDANGNPMMRIDNEEAMRRHHRALARFVVRVENCTGPAGPILTGANLAEHGHTALVTEVFHEVMRAVELTADEIKKSEGSHASLLVATQASVGTVASASAQKTNEPATAQEDRASSSI